MAAVRRHSLGSVALVGAGPGDPGLITVRGMALLRGADVVVYDRLVSPSLLSFARAGAELIDVGKRARAHTKSQAEINRLLVQRARVGKTVVRLKGGDPFVFGRGGEEAEALARAKVAFEVVPGVTSAIAGPAAAGIPVTHRESASSVAIATAHAATGKASKHVDWSALARADTVVMVMVMKHLGSTAEALIDAGRSAQTPAAVVADATLPTQKTVKAPLGRIAAAAKRAGIQAPAVLVVGEVVRLRDLLGGWDTRPLSFQKILVTRSREQASELSSILRELGADVVEAPAIRVEPPRSWGPLDRAIERLRRGTLDWIVFTSATGVRHLFSRVRAMKLDARAFANVKVCAVGPATANTLERAGIAADLVPPTFTTEALGKAFPRGKGRVLLARADVAEPSLEDAISRKGWAVERVTAYRVTGTKRIEPTVRRAVLDGSIDVITFASSGTVRAFMKLLRGKLPRGTKVVCIGPETAKAARAAGLRVRAVAKPHTIPGLAAAVVEATGKR